MAVSGDRRWFGAEKAAAPRRRPKSPAAGYTAKYDAWNRLVAVKSDASTFVQKNEFDALNRRIVKQAYSSGSLVETRHYYYNERWQVVEERVGTTGESARVDAQYAYNPDYVDSVALRYWDSDATGGPETYHYYLQDANYNVTALVNASGAVVERYAYSPYGEVTVLNGASDADSGVSDWSNDANNASDVKNGVLFTGRERDPETGLQLNRFRFYHPQLGRWVNRDPIGYAAGRNLLSYIGDASLDLVDPMGLAPFQGGLLNPEQIAREIRDLIRDGKSRYEILNYLAKFHSLPENGRYFWTEKYGWVDSRHFFTAALTSQQTSPAFTIVSGYAVEVNQWLFQSDSKYKSAFSYEDLPSNQAGAMWGYHIGTNGSLLDDFLDFAEFSGAKHCKDSPADQLPLVVPRFLATKGQEVNLRVEDLILKSILLPDR